LAAVRATIRRECTQQSSSTGGDAEFGTGTTFETLPSAAEPLPLDVDVEPKNS
jgi:hypothetical protein